MGSQGSRRLEPRAEISERLRRINGTSTQFKQNNYSHFQQNTYSTPVSPELTGCFWAIILAALSAQTCLAREPGGSIKPIGSLRSSVSIKLGAQAPGSNHKTNPEPAIAGDSAKFSRLSPGVAGSGSFYWHINLGLAPQALCLRLLSHAKKTSPLNPGHSFRKNSPFLLRARVCLHGTPIRINRF